MAGRIMVVMDLHGSQEAREKVVLRVQGWVMLAWTRLTGEKKVDSCRVHFGGRAG